jgi:hypothetical protein
MGIGYQGTIILSILNKSYNSSNLKLIIGCEFPLCMGGTAGIHLAVAMVER